MLRQHGGDLELLVGAQCARIAAFAARVHAGLHESRAQRARLLRGLRPDVVAFDQGAQAMGRRDRLQASHAESHHQHACRPDGARCRRHLRQDASEMRGPELYRVVAGQGRLARQRIHRLRARDARHALHREAGDLPVHQALDERRLLARVDEADQQRPWLHRVDDIDVGRLDGQHHVGVAQHRRAIRRDLDVDEVGIARMDRTAGARLHVQPGAELDQPGDERRNESHPALVDARLGQYRDVDVHGQTGAWKSPVRTSFLFTNSWMPMLPSSRP